MKWTNNSSACRECPMNSFPTPTPCRPRPYYYATNNRIGPADKHYFREYCVINMDTNVNVVTHEYHVKICHIPAEIITHQWIRKNCLGGTCALSRYKNQQIIIFLISDLHKSIKKHVQYLGVLIRNKDLWRQRNKKIVKRIEDKRVGVRLRVDREHAVTRITK